MLTGITIVSPFGGRNLAVGQSIGGMKGKSDHEIAICDLFDRLDAPDGKQVVVRGIYRFSHELAGLYSSNGCHKPLILDGVKRAEALDIEFVGTSLEQRSALEDFALRVHGGHCDGGLLECNSQVDQLC